MFLTDAQLSDFNLNCKATYYNLLQDIFVTRQTTVNVSQENDIINLFRKANLYIAALDSYTLNNTDKNIVADALAGLRFDGNRIFGYCENGYWLSDYAV